GRAPDGLGTPTGTTRLPGGVPPARAGARSVTRTSPSSRVLTGSQPHRVAAAARASASIALATTTLSFAVANAVPPNSAGPTSSFGADGPWRYVPVPDRLTSLSRPGPSTEPFGRTW